MTRNGRRELQLNLRIDEAERRRLDAAAEEVDLRTSTYTRAASLYVARRVLSGQISPADLGLNP